MAKSTFSNCRFVSRGIGGDAWRARLDVYVYKQPAKNIAHSCVAIEIDYVYRRVRSRSDAVSITVEIVLWS